MPQLTYSDDYADLAEKAVGNWQRFESFGYHGAPDDADNRVVVYTSNRDSDLIDKANAISIAELMAEYIESGDCIEESHSHWACGYVDGYSIRVYDESGAPTAAFCAWVDIQRSLDDYPVLNDEALSKLESEASDESYDNWARSDFERGIEKSFDVELMSDIDDKVRELFDECRDRANEYWEADGSGMTIDVDSIVSEVTTADLADLVARHTVRIYCDGYVLCDGSMGIADYSCDMPLYGAEFDACMAAIDNDEQSVCIDGKVYTWHIC